MNRRGAPQARLSADGERAGDGAYGGVHTLFGFAACNMCRNDSDSEHAGVALDLFYRRVCSAWSGVPALYEETLPPARGVSEVTRVLIAGK